jgi:sodium/hydrogen antiporter
VLLNWAVFIWLGAVCPWELFAPSVTGADRILAPLPLWRLGCLAISVIGLRRIPSVLALYKVGLLKPNVSSLQEAFFAGYFGPIGVSALFYLHVGLEYLERDIFDVEGGQVRDNARDLFHMMEVTVWFVTIASVVGDLVSYMYSATPQLT